MARNKDLWKYNTVIGSIRKDKTVNLKLSVQAHSDLKSYCSKIGYTMQDYIYNLIAKDMQERSNNNE